MRQSITNHLLVMSMLAFISLVGSSLNAFAVEQEGTPVSITGELQVFYQDDFDNQRSDMVYELVEKGSKKRFKLHFKDKNASKHLRPGQTITVRGKAKGRDLFLAASDGETQSVQVLEPAAMAAAAVAGQQRTIVMVADFTDASVSCSVPAIQNLMFTDPTDQSVDDLYQRSSLNQVSFTGNVAGPFPISFSSTDSCDVYAWGQAMDAAAQDSGIDLSQYDRIVYALPQANSCGYAGIGQVGAKPSRSWIFRCDVEDVYAHELGHNLGMGHAATPTYDYGDTSDIMGYSGVGLRQLNAPHVEQMGWYDPQRLVSTTTTGYYDVAPLVTDSVPIASQILKVAKPDTGDFYYISYRQPTGFDGNLSADYLNRLSIHTYMGDGSSRKSYLIQTLGDGETFVDAVNGISITQVSHFPEYATALVEVDDSAICVSSTPNLTVSPGTQTGSPGDSLNYSVTVSNGDGANCEASTFLLNQTLPVGWSGSMGPASLTLQPGETASATFIATSSAISADGNYDLSIEVSDASEPVHSNAASLTYTVQTPCTADTPTVSISPVNQSAAPGSVLAYTLSVTNRDSQNCAQSSFALNSIVPTGWAGSLSKSSLALTPGGTGTAVLSVTSAASAADGSYPLGVDVTDTSAAAHTASTTATYTVVNNTADSIAPTAPNGLSASLKRKQANLVWNPATDNVGVSGYQVWRDGLLLAETVDTSFIDRTVPSGTVCTYFVVATDAAGNESAASNIATVGESSGGGGNGGGKGKRR